MDHASLALWDHLIEAVKQTPLSREPDSPIWKLESNGTYPVKPFYEQINFGGVVSTIGDSLWKVICPQKIHVFFMVMCL